MTATPTPLRDTIDQMRDIADVAERYSVEELRDVLREQARRLAAVAPAGMEAVFTADEVAEAMEVLRGRHGSTALIGEVLDDMERVLLAAAPTPPATAGEA